MAFGLSIDWEDYFVAENIRGAYSTQFPGKPTGRLDYSTKLTLELLAKHQISATFFILGMAAEAHPALVKLISEAGHEIASHGHSHQLVYNQTEAEFKEDITSSKDLIEDLTGQSVKGYRAPNFSITSKTPWAHAAIKAAGYQYDSSLYPINHHRYANPDGKRYLYPNKDSLTIVPLATYRSKLLQRNLPLAGGAYWRILPKFYTDWGLQQLAKDNNNYFFYFHPWELDPNQPKVEVSSHLAKFKHYYHLKQYSQILDNIFTQYKFTKYSDLI